MTQEPRFRLTKTPSGPRLYQYFAAILKLTGMEDGHAYPLNRFFKNLSQHLNTGRLERVNGGFRLTPAGQSYFADRYRTGNPQHIEEVDVRSMLKGLAEGGPGWEKLG